MRVLLAGALLLAALATTAAAQEVTPSGPHPLATRAQLEKQLASLPPDEKNGAIATVIRERLANGDFLPGDRIQLVVVGDTAFSKTFSVRPDTTIELPNIDPISLHGVLRSELDAYLDQKLRKYLTDPDVQARSLIRLAVVGEVARPGFYDLPPDAAASEVIVAGGWPLASGRSAAYCSEAEQRDDLQQVSGPAVLHRWGVARRDGSPYRGPVQRRPARQHQRSPDHRGRQRHCLRRRGVRRSLRW